MSIEGTNNSEVLVGTAASDIINAYDGNDVITGGLGNDTINGGAGNNTYVFNLGDGADLIKAYYDTTPYLGNDTGKLNTISFGSGIAPSAIDVYRSGINLVLSIVGTTDSITIENFYSGNNHLNAYNPIQQVTFSDGTVWNLETLDDKAFTGNATSETFEGTVVNDTFNGMGGSDTFTSNGGNDTYLFGKGDGADLIKAYYDTRDYLGSDAGKFNTIAFKAGVLPSEIDVYRSGVNLVLSIVGTTDSITIENFYSGNNHLNAYNPIQQVTFSDGTVWNLETLDDKAFTGNASSEMFYGTVLNDTFNGMGGSDTFISNGGNDTYLFGKGDGADLIKGYYDTRDYLGNDTGKFNTIAFKAGVLPSEIDAYRSGDNLVLSIIGTTDSITVEKFYLNDNHWDAFNPVQHVTFSDGTVWNLETLDDKAFTGNASSETFYGTVLNDTFNGMAGNDTFTSKGGNDTYLFGKGDGNDIIQSYYDTRDYLGNDSGKYNVLSLKSGVLPSEVSISRVGSGTDIEVSILGVDSVLIRNFFSDMNPAVYAVYNAYNPIQSIKFANGTVWSQQDIINHVILGETVSGTVGDDVLVGTIKNDDFFGFTGNDTYIVNDVGDKINETSTSPTEIDTVMSSVTYTLSANVENLTLTGAAAINATGNSLSNTLIGNSANNALNGGAGADVMMGGAGNDTYSVDNVGDQVVEQSGAGVDTIQSYLSAYTLGSQLENLRIMGAGVANGTGNELDNIIYAGAGNNVIDGLSGIDTVSYAAAVSGVNVNLTNPSAQATGGSGSDTLVNIENLQGSNFNDVLIGNAAANVLQGGSGNDHLSGAGGADQMFGEAGDDAYVIDHVGDKVTELVNSGIDKVYAYYVNYTLTSNVENLQLMGTASNSGTGNELSNIIQGNSGSNLIAGGLGNDTLSGGVGQDSFVFNTTLNAISNKDTITDFNVVDDTIKLENNIFTKLTTLGTLVATNFSANATGVAVDSNDFICYNTATGVLSYDADGNGAGASVTFAMLGATVHPALTAADFVVI